MPRSHLHDYKSGGLYHITMSKAPGIPFFGNPEGGIENPHIHLNQVGISISREIMNIPEIYPMLGIYQFIVMPDHIHFIIHVKEYLRKSIGSYLGAFKVRAGKRCAEECGIRPPLFKEDYYDRIIYPHHDLNYVFRYIRDNPRRLIVRREHPEFFTRIDNVRFYDREWSVYGNMDLMRNPFKAAVIIHRRDSAYERERKHDLWMHLAENGGVLVSPFISPSEKEVRDEAFRRGGRVIFITNKPLGERFKPGDENFDRCALGEYLVMAPMTPLPDGRSTWLYLNGTAERLAQPRR